MKIRGFYREQGQDYEAILARAMGSEAFLSMLLHSFEKDETFNGLKLAVEGGQAEAIFDQAHTLKGLTANLGLKRLYDKTSVLVELTRKGETKGAKEAFDQIEDTYNQTMTMLGTVEDAEE